MKPLFLVIPVADKFGFGGMESHFLAMVDHFRKNPVSPLSVVGFKNFQECFYGSFLGEWGINYQGVIDPSNPAATSAEFLRLIPDGSLIFFNSPHWYSIFRKIKETKKNCRIVVRSGGNDIWLPWKFRESGQERTFRWLKQVFTASNQFHAVLREKVRAINAYADGLIVNSRFTYEKAMGLGISGEKLQIVAGGVDHGSIQPKTHREKDELRVINACRLKKFKGLEYTIRAFAHAQKHSAKRLSLHILGDGEELNSLKDLVVSCGATEIHFLSQVPYHQILDHYAAADIHLHLPTVVPFSFKQTTFFQTETMGRSYLEASAAGIPNIATEVGGVGDVVFQGQNGFLVPDKDFVAAGNRILELQDANLRNQLGTSGRKLVESQLSWEKVFQNYQELFRRWVDA